jgi:hypothetical protein
MLTINHMFINLLNMYLGNLKILLCMLLFNRHDSHSNEFVFHLTFINYTFNLNDLLNNILFIF